MMGMAYNMEERQKDRISRGTGDIARTGGHSKHLNMIVTESQKRSSRLKKNRTAEEHTLSECTQYWALHMLCQG